MYNVAEVGTSLPVCMQHCCTCLALSSCTFASPCLTGLSPKMGMAVDRHHVFILGGVPLSVKVYLRKPEADGVHKLVDEYFHGALCVPGCKAHCHACPKTCKTWTGMTYPCKCRTEVCKEYEGNIQYKWAFFSGDNFNFNFNNCDLCDESNIRNVMDETAGGHLVVQTNKNSIAERVYGVSHCGTVFMIDMIEPGTRRAIVLKHVNPWQYHRVEVGLALQTYHVGLEVINNLFISVSEAYLQRFAPSSISATPLNVPVKQRVWKNQYNKRMPTSGVREIRSEIMKLSVNGVLSSDDCHNLTLTSSSKIASWPAITTLEKSCGFHQKSPGDFSVYSRAHTIFQH